MWTIQQTDENFSRVWGEKAEFENELEALDSLVDDFTFITYITTLESKALVYHCRNIMGHGGVYVVVKEEKDVTA